VIHEAAGESKTTTQLRRRAGVGDPAGPHVVPAVM